MSETKKKFKLTLGRQVLIGALLGIVVGLILGENASHLKIIGDLILRILQMPVILLIMGVIAEAVGSVSPKQLGRIGVKTLILFAISTAIAAVIGIGVAFLFKPGNMLIGEAAGITSMDTTAYTIPEASSAKDQFLSYFSKNMFDSMSSGNTVQCLIVAIMFGVTLSIYGAKHEKNPVLTGLKHVNAIVLEMVSLFVRMIPFAVFSFFSYALGVIGPKLLGTLAYLILADVVGTLLMFILYMLITCAYCKVNPIRFVQNSLNTVAIALSTSSSAATLPAKMADGEEKFGVSPLVNRLVAPLGSTMNTDGAVFCYGLYCIVICQIFQIPITGALIFNIIASATLLSFGSITVSGGGFIMFGMVLASVGLPTAGMVIIAPADNTILGRVRCVVNCIDDTMIGMIVAKSEGEFDPDIYNGKKAFDPNGPVSYCHHAE